MRGPVSPYQRLVMCALCAKNNAKQKCVRYLVPRRIVSRFRHNGQRNSQRDARPAKTKILIHHRARRSPHTGCRADVTTAVVFTVGFARRGLYVDVWHRQYRVECKVLSTLAALSCLNYCACAAASASRHTPR